MAYDLKKSLSHLGYLKYDTHSDNQRHETNNVFNGSLKLALKKYQEFYSLSITGILDASTIAKMQEPQCGLPNFSIPNESLIHKTSHYSFFPSHPKWGMRKLKYAFNRNIQEDAKPSLEQALKEWAFATPFAFSHVNNLNQANIKISFMRKYHGDGHPFRVSEAGVVHAFALPDGRVHFDSAQNWSSNVERNAYDIQTVGLHELGHALGLGRSWIEKAVTYPIIYPGERKGLHEDDIKGVKALYKF